MKTKRTHFGIRLGTFLLIPLYLLIVAAHLFFTPNFHSDARVRYNPAFTRNTELIYNLIRTDRCFANEGKKSEQSAKKALTTLGLHYATLKPVIVIRPVYYYNHPFLSDHHFTYLANRILRIWSLIFFESEGIEKFYLLSIVCLLFILKNQDHENN